MASDDTAPIPLADEPPALLVPIQPEAVNPSAPPPVSDSEMVDVSTHRPAEPPLVAAATAAATGDNTTNTTATGGSGFYVNVKTLTGQSFRIACEPTDTILTIKQKLQDTDGIEVEPDRQRLIFMGKELSHETVLATNQPPITCGSAIHLVLRIGGPGAGASIAAISGGQQQPIPGAAGGAAGGERARGGSRNDPRHIVLNLNRAFPVRANDEVEADLYTLNRDVERSSSQLRIFGVLFGLLGVIDLILGANKGQIYQVVLALLFVAIGAIAFYAGLYRTTRGAQVYFFSMIFFILAFAGVSIADAMTTDTPSSYGLVASVLLSALFPILMCSACVWCARLHWVNCRTRDELLLAHPHHAPIPPAGVPFMRAEGVGAAQLGGGGGGGGGAARPPQPHFIA